MRVNVSVLCPQNTLLRACVYCNGFMGRYSGSFHLALTITQCIPLVNLKFRDVRHNDKSITMTAERERERGGGRPEKMSDSSAVVKLSKS